MKLLLALVTCMIVATTARAQETSYTSWGGFNGLSAGWSKRHFFAESGQVWDNNGFDLTSTRRHTVRFAGAGLEGRLGGRRTFLSAGAGLYLLESNLRDLDGLGFFSARYGLSLGPGARLRLGTSLGGRASLLLTQTWLPRLRSEKLPTRPLTSVGFGWSY
jgi:hypothetical protein